jgi:hypothetical protein
MEDEKLPKLEDSLFQSSTESDDRIFNGTTEFLSTINVILWIIQLLMLVVLFYVYDKIFTTSIEFFSFFGAWFFNWYVIRGINKMKKAFLLIHSNMDKMKSLIK